ncbi:hypothetical protein GGR53DRAFT_123081 [Hypoxylon sp. FL1150]|nr:hypothetical protein GGR53DRAFT_123081 [Hypoxylon sp. FL1150]
MTRRAVLRVDQSNKRTRPYEEGILHLIENQMPRYDRAERLSNIFIPRAESVSDAHPCYDLLRCYATSILCSAYNTRPLLTMGFTSILARLGVHSHCHRVPQWDIRPSSCLPKIRRMQLVPNIPVGFCRCLEPCATSRALITSDKRRMATFLDADLSQLCLCWASFHIQFRASDPIRTWLLLVSSRGLKEKGKNHVATNRTGPSHLTGSGSGQGKRRIACGVGRQKEHV